MITPTTLVKKPVKFLTGYNGSEGMPLWQPPRREVGAMHITITVSISLPATALYLWWRTTRRKRRVTLTRPLRLPRSGSYIYYTSPRMLMQIEGIEEVIEVLNRSFALMIHYSDKMLVNKIHGGRRIDPRDLRLPVIDGGIGARGRAPEVPDRSHRRAVWQPRARRGGSRR